MLENEVENEFNDGHIVEGFDRCHTIMLLIDELLRDHPAVLKVDGNCHQEKAIEEIMKLYQKIGNLD